MLNGQPDLQIIDISVRLTDNPSGSRVAYGSLIFGVGERKLLAKTFTVFRSAKDGSLFASWPKYESKQKKGEWFEQDPWLDNDEKKYWGDKIAEEVNKLIGVKSTPPPKPSKEPDPEPVGAAESETVPAGAGKRVGWRKK